MNVQDYRPSNTQKNTHYEIIGKLCQLIADEPCSRGLDCITIREFIKKHEIHNLFHLKYPEQITYICCNHDKNKDKNKNEEICLYPGSPLVILQDMVIGQGLHADLFVNSVYPDLNI